MRSVNGLGWTQVHENSIWETITDQNNTGPVSSVPDLSSIPGLGYLDLSRNQLNGSIPTGKLSDSITTIGLSNTSLTGTIPAKFSGIPRLQKLSLAVASHVFVMDPWWNPAVERQAQDRIHRIGRYKPIRIVRFIMENTVEERILTLQKKKEDLFESTLGDSEEAVGRLTENDFKSLFE